MNKYEIKDLDKNFYLKRIFLSIGLKKLHCGNCFGKAFVNENEDLKGITETST